MEPAFEGGALDSGWMEIVDDISIEGNVLFRAEAVGPSEAMQNELRLCCFADLRTEAGKSGLSAIFPLTSGVRRGIPLCGNSEHLNS